MIDVEKNDRRHPMGPMGIIIQCTLTCPLRCAHCATDSNPTRTERIPLADLLNMVDIAALVGASRIGFTGGDPFLLQKDLVSCILRAREHSLYTVIITSAYWATSERIALRVLEPYASLGMLALSTDSFHTPYVSIERIRNAIRAARTLRINRVELQVTGLDDDEITVVRDKLGDDGVDLPIRFQKLWPIGQASGISRNEDGFVSIDDLDLTCPMGLPFLMTTGQVVGCCSSITKLGDDNPVLLGNWSRGNLAEILTNYNGQEYYFFLKTFGLRPLVQHLQRKGMVQDKDLSATDVCHLCYKLHSEREIRAELVNAVTGRGQ